MKKLVLIVILIGVIAAIAQKMKLDREQWQGLTEDELRNRLEQRFPSAMPEEKREAVTNKVVDKMRGRGMLADDESEIDLDADSPIDTDTTSEAKSVTT